MPVGKDDFLLQFFIAIVEGEVKNKFVKKRKEK